MSKRKWTSVFPMIAGTIIGVILPSTIAVRAACAAGDLKVMSFNVRYSKVGASEAKAENNWNDPVHPRRDRAVRVILDYGPDLLGVQEARDHQIKDLRSSLTGYDFYGIGRDDGKTAGEYAGIFYRRDRFRRVAQGSFWLSATPETPGTTFHTRPAAVPRIASWLKLADNTTGREFLLLNMHWDNESESARRKSASLVRTRLATLADGLPAIVMGDLNAIEDSPAVRSLMGSEGDGVAHFADSFREVHPDRKPDEASYNNWEGVTTGSRIDFILSTANIKPLAAEIVRTAYDGRWPSDHYPVTATLRWQNSQ
jgi:endonuclease/exonuclease/phosphatase family metal-dependent hydrolase